MIIYRSYDKSCDEDLEDLRKILKCLSCTVSDTNPQLFRNLKHYYRNLHIRNRRHKDYNAAIDIIEKLIYKVR